MRGSGERRRCWGFNLLGQLGDGTTTSRATPVRVTGLSSGTTSIVAGGNHTCAIQDGGAALCWGYGPDGVLGNGSPSNRLTPVPVSGLSSGVEAIAAASLHTCALMDNGSVKC